MGKCSLALSRVSYPEQQGKPTERAVSESALWEIKDLALDKSDNMIKRKIIRIELFVPILQLDPRTVLRLEQQNQFPSTCFPTEEK